MANNVFLISDFEIKTNQSFFFDNNIWMFLFCPIGDYNRKKQESVSKLFENIIDRNNSIIINGLILSEFSNAYLRLDFKLWKEEKQLPLANFKNDYFHSERAKETRQIISSIIRSKILKFSDKHPDSFNALNFDEILSYYEILDYNDAIIYYECKNKKWILVTDDSDFLKLTGLKVLKP